MLLAGVLAMAFSSCITRRNVNLLQDKSLSTNTSKLFENKKFEYRIQVNDVLSIRVMGLDEETHRYFNVENQNGGIGVSDASLYVNGFSVDKNGQVQLPTVGKVKVQGLTVFEAQELVQRKVNEYFTNATVILKMVNFRISVLGDVKLPGYYYVYNNQITVLEAVSMAGSVGEFADKRHVTLMRQSDRGVQALYLDMTDTDLLSSEYYYLLPNDVIYVPTLKARPGRLNMDLLGILFTGISAGILVLSFINSNQ